VRVKERRLSARPGRCRALRRRTLHYALQTSIIRTYALASRLRAIWMEARVTKVARVSVRFSKSLARRRLRPNQEKLRSTTQRRGRTTKPVMSSLRLTISVRSGGTLATARQPARRCSPHRPRSVRAKGAPAYLVEDEPGPVAVLDRVVDVPELHRFDPLSFQQKDPGQNHSQQ
jgi:hypothetical protein